MAEENVPGEEQHRFSTVEAIVGGFIFGILDALDVPLVGIPLTDIVSWTSHIYLHFKGASGEVGQAQKIVSAAQKVMLGGNIAEVPPVGDSFPFRTIAWGITIFVDRRPNSWLARKILQAEKVVEATEKLKGGNEPKEGHKSEDKAAAEKSTAEEKSPPTAEGGGGAEKQAPGKRATGPGPGGQPEEDAEQPEEPEDEYAGMTEDQKRIMQELEGNWVGLALKEYLDPEEILRRIGPSKMANDNQPEAAGQSQAKRYNSKEVNLKDDQQKSKAV